MEKANLRIARIATAAYVEGADKLLQLTFGPGGETRNVSYSTHPTRRTLLDTADQPAGIAVSPD